MTLQVTPIVGQSPDIKDIVAALVKAQGDIHHAKKNQENEHFDSSYADLSAVIDALKSGHLGGLAIDVYEEEAALFFEDHSDEVLTDDEKAEQFSMMICVSRAKGDRIGHDL